jgi:hypothetical protein
MRLISSFLVQRQIAPALETPGPVPIRFRVADEENAGAWGVDVVGHVLLSS